MTLKVRVIPCLPAGPQRHRCEDRQNIKNVEAL